MASRRRRGVERGDKERSQEGGREGGGVEERNQPTVTLAEAYHNTISHLLQYLPCQSLKGLERGGGGGGGGEVRMKCSGTHPHKAMTPSPVAVCM